MSSQVVYWLNELAHELCEFFPLTYQLIELILNELYVLNY